LSGCNTVGSKTASQSIIYSAAAAFSFCLLIGCFFLVKKSNGWFLTLFSSVFVVNIGYTILSFSSCLETALWANRLAYLGSVFLPLTMLMIILKVSGINHPKWLPWLLGFLSVFIFLIAASPGILPIYYKEVSFAVINGVSSLIKIYGPLHPIYLFYLSGYFSAMVAVIIYASVRKNIETAAHAILLTFAVFVNIGVWLIEQLVSINFEMLSLSYIISELFLLGVHFIMRENQKLRTIVKQVETTKKYSITEKRTNALLEKPLVDNSITPEQIELFVMGIQSLTPTEKAIFEAYIARLTTKEIMKNLNIKESTLKYHNRNIYGKLGVSSRKELLEIHKYIKSIKTNLSFPY
jgi:DNA-binding CsgD family transcriptional regulator